MLVECIFYVGTLIFKAESCELNSWWIGERFRTLLRSVEVEFTNGSTFRLSAEFLRICSPAADGKMRSIGGEKVIFGRRHVGIMKVEPIGNYGVRIIFDDLHKTGIYTWDYFYHLGSNKFALMREYINTLKKHGLSRDPSRRK
ncbi:uncharacterized protein LOC115751126 isoform X1 [Rhodamnia argentea]|uniref:Uncharacterized protein LOC115751126 isoform X1 n=1 Tax=Rhodamnia argentea TaxID=178133 RepID=A0ABM3GV99_9MYRT|nr:uncharacterized protein LOC115751126 isoform X1 [Rhodamnia argentea]